MNEGMRDSKPKRRSVPYKIRAVVRTVSMALLILVIVVTLVNFDFWMWTH